MFSIIMVSGAAWFWNVSSNNNTRLPQWGQWTPLFTPREMGKKNSYKIAAGRRIMILFHSRLRRPAPLGQIVLRGRGWANVFVPLIPGQLIRKARRRAVKLRRRSINPFQNIPLLFASLDFFRAGSQRRDITKLLFTASVNKKNKK